MDDYKTITEIARKVIPFLSKKGIPLTPKNYRIWFEYFHGIMSDIKEILDDTKEPVDDVKARHFISRIAVYRTDDGKNILMINTEDNQKAGEFIKNELNLEEGETSPDYQFTLETVACLGACFLAPAMMVNRTYFGKLSPPKVAQNTCIQFVLRVAFRPGVYGFWH